MTGQSPGEEGISTPEFGSSVVDMLKDQLSSMLLDLQLSQKIADGAILFL